VKIVAAILARVESPDSPNHLLPRRALFVIHGKTVLEWIAEKLRRSSQISRVIVAVGDSVEDGEIIELARRIGLGVYAGYPDSVLDRLHLVAKEEGADHIVRVNGNFPLVDVAALDELVISHLAIGADLSLNSHYHGIVYGLGVEILRRETLARVTAENLDREKKNLGTLYLIRNPDQYRLHLAPAPRTAPHLRVSVDFETDLPVVAEIMAKVSRPENASVIDFLESRLDLTAAQEVLVPAEVSLEKALLFPDKMQALRRNNCLTYDTTYPISVELSLTNKCNHRCIWCSDADMRRRLGGELTEEEIFPVLEELKIGGTRGVVIEGGGEPTLHAGFLAVLRRIKELGLAAGLISNGYRLPYAEAVDNFEWIRISLDAASRNQYRDLKGIDGFDRVISNLMTIAANKRQAILGVGYVLTNRNDDPVQMEQLVRFLRKIGVNYFHIRPVVDHPELTSRTDLDFLKKYETRGFSVNISALTDNREAGNWGLPCLAHSLSTVITADGGVYLCGRLNIHESWEPLGNIHSQSFHEIWTGDKRRAQVRLVSEADFCKTHCPQCRMTKYNRLLSEVDRIRTRNFI